MPPAPHLLLDVRGLEAPEPLVRVLSALEELGSDERLKMIIDQYRDKTLTRLPGRVLVESVSRMFIGIIRIHDEYTWA